MRETLRHAWARNLLGWRPARTVARGAIRLWCKWTVARRLRLRIEGIDNVPESGPVLLVSRHVHHLFDGVVFLALFPRPLCLLVALDWAPNRVMRAGMEIACRLAGWPVVLRSDRLERSRPTGAAPFRSAYGKREVVPYLRRATHDSVAILRQGQMLVIFPEAYPAIDPMETPRSPSAEMLPFRTGFVRLTQAAERDGVTRVQIVPVGLQYAGKDPWLVHVRFGEAMRLEPDAAVVEVALRVEMEVRKLSGVTPVT